jgi:hypothetical protein
MPPGFPDPGWYHAVKSVWPRRLLHVPSMTSFERQEGDIYGQTKEPDYSIVSYTWGRYQVDRGRRLQVNGISWPIPAIDEAHFSVESLETLLRNVSSKYEYVWIDIACIDQSSQAVKMMEVGRQAGIFAGSRDAYVWLTYLEPRELRRHLTAVLKIGYELTQEGRDVRDALKPLLCALEAIFQDPWFSSLWCLQESVLQRSAVFVDRDGDIVTAPGPWYPHSFATQVSLVDISVTCSTVLDTLRPEFNGRPAAWTSTDPSSEDLERWHRLLKLLEEASMDFGICSNHNVQYGAARFRQTTCNEDRIYAIMQIYGFQLGEAAEPGREFTLDELELQFLRSLHTQSPILAQAFLHLDRPPSGESWSITPRSTVPFHLRMFLAERLEYNGLHHSCAISIHSRHEASFTGKACTMSEMTYFWNERDLSIMQIISKDKLYLSDSLETQQRLSQSRQAVLFDRHMALDKLSSEWPPDTEKLGSNGILIIEHRGDKLQETLRLQQEYCQAIVAKFGDRNLRILHLGYILSDSIHLALILRSSGQDIWTRIGICFWRSSVLTQEADEKCQPRWHDLEGNFG